MSIITEFLTRLTGTKVWKWVTKKVLARANMRLLGNSKLPMEKWYEIEKICKENQDKLLVFVSYGTKLSSVLLRWVARASWTHAGVVLVSKDGKVQIVHMESAGLLQQVLLELMRELDDLAILEIPLSDQELERAWRIMDQYVQRKPGYDFQFLLNNPALYCSELIYEMVKDTGRFQTHTEQGRQVFEPVDVYGIGKVLFEYRNKKGA